MILPEVIIMSVNVNFYSLIKRENSTKQPTSTPTVFPCTFIDDTSLMNPRLKLSIQFNPISFNYVYIADFNRYYFIREINTYQNFWHISLEEDTMASFRDQIGLGRHYVIRSSHSYDGLITDNMYPAKASAIEQLSYPVQGNPFDWSSDHSYVLGIVGEASSDMYQIGSLVYYHMDETALKFFIKWLMDNVDDWSGLNGEYSQGVQQALINPMQYIKSCIVVPVAPPAADSQHRPSTIKFGYYEYTVGGAAYGKVACLLASSPMAYETDLISIPKHPQATTRGRYLNCQPFSNYEFHFGPFGDIPLDPMVLNRNDDLFYSLAYDLTSGVCRLLLKGNDIADDVLFNGSAQIGVSINISQVYVDGLAQTKVETESLFSMVGAVGGAITNPMGVVSAAASVAEAATSGIQDATRLNYPMVSGLPCSGSLLPYHDTWNIYLLHKYFEIVDENLEELGRPLCAYAVINTLSGYTLCLGADCQISGTQIEAQKINNYLNSGFFYE